MTRLSHAALVEEVAQLIPNVEGRLGYGDRERAQATSVLSLIAARLSDVTPEMVEAVAKAMAADEGWGWDNPETLRDWWINQARVAISAFLAASPLAARMDSP